ncbi:benzoate-CoA ligase family protein [Marivibrio halodurans]|uniref:Benzoate-CoA ligase family protein n=1 Tax=Marivibrio halodurans TaxID=2039722 RepID=A0A8J7V3S1_9PROT|nr:benzoate-CoA ligase family protein [Marivibrio halodurans]MBP5858282.1 benzoate-CoA ligase family protein [Marivibrio halodurans]
MTDITDRVPRDAAPSREIGFACPERYNASSVLFDNLDRGRGERTAVLCPAGDFTYGALCALAGRIGNALIAQGLERGDRVLCFMEDHGPHLAAIFGAIRAGFVPMLINTQSTDELIDFYLEDSGARVVVCDKTFREKFARAAVERIVTIDPFDIGAEGAESLATFIADQPETLDAADTHRDEMAFWMYSSGSTGKPKGVVHLHHDMPYTAEAYAKPVLGLTEGDICFSVPKIFFAYGFGNSATFPFSVGGATVLMPEAPKPPRIFEMVETYRPTRFFGLPTLYTALVKHESAVNADFSSVETCVSAAEILSEEIFDTWRRRFGHDILEGLGSTEVLHIYLSNRMDRRKLGSAGMRLPGYAIKLTTKEGAPVERGEEGIMWVLGDSNAPCYWNRPDKTAETMRDGWIYTGDRFIEDEDGFFFFRGRADDLVKVSGQWVYPLEVELTLANHPAVHECAVLAVEMADRRMTLRAHVVLTPGTEPGEATTKALQGFVKEKLVPYKYPRDVVYMDELPKTGTGKIDRARLKAAQGEVTR